MKILLIGCGKMGSAMLNGWLVKKFPTSLIKIVDPNLKQNFGVETLDAVDDLPKDYSPDFVIIAIKPQDFDTVLPQLKRFSKATFISIAAGRTTRSIEKALGKVLVIRAMPNLPATIGKGITALVSNRNMIDSISQNVEIIFSSMGNYIWLEDEKLMDAVTALSGSGPAYMFLFLESLVKGGEALGLPLETARQLAIETMIGSAELARNYDLTRLRQDVTSKGGTTEAALSVLMDNDSLQSMVVAAMQQAEEKSRKLSS